MAFATSCVSPGRPIGMVSITFCASCFGRDFHISVLISPGQTLLMVTPSADISLERFLENASTAALEAE